MESHYFQNRDHIFIFTSSRMAAKKNEEKKSSRSEKKIEQEMEDLGDGEERIALGPESREATWTPKNPEEGRVLFKYCGVPVRFGQIILSNILTSGKVTYTDVVPELPAVINGSRMMAIHPRRWLISEV